MHECMHECMRRHAFTQVCARAWVCTHTPAYACMHAHTSAKGRDRHCCWPLHLLPPSQKLKAAAGGYASCTIAHARARIPGVISQHACTHTSSHARTRMHACMHSSMHERTLDACMHACFDAHTCTRAHARTDTHAYMQGLTPRCTHASMRASTHANMLPRMRAYTRAHASTHVGTHGYADVQRGPLLADRGGPTTPTMTGPDLEQARAHARMLRRTRLCTHARSDAHMQESGGATDVTATVICAATEARATEKAEVRSLGVLRYFRVRC